MKPGNPINTTLDLNRRDVLGLFAKAVGAMAGAKFLAGCEPMTPNPIPINPPPTNYVPDAGTQPSLPQFTLQSNFATLPARYVSGLRVYVSRLLGVGTFGGGQKGDRNQLFIVDPSQTSFPLQPQTYLEITDENNPPLNQLTVDPSFSRAVVSSLAHFYDITLGDSPRSNLIAFPSGYDFGGGAEFDGGKVFIATANGDVDANASVIFKINGTLHVYDVNASGIDASSWRKINLLGKNSTGVGYRRAGELVVVNSGAYGSGDGATLDIINTNTEKLTKTISLKEKLEGLTAQVSGDVAVTRDGSTAILGTSSFDRTDGKLLFVDLNSSGIETLALPGTSFVSSVQLDDDLGVGFATNFNTGDISIFPLQAPRGLLQILNAGGEAGLSVVYNGKLIQAIPYSALNVHPV